VPQHPAARTGNLDRRLAAHVHQARDGHAEGIADPGQRGQVGARAALLQGDEHALAAGAIGLLLFYMGFATAPMSVVAPVPALAAALLPLGVAVGPASCWGLFERSL
jgi:hypothetical protein